MNFTPNAAQLAQQVRAYVGDAESIVKASLASSQGSNAFADVYHISLSTDAVLRGLANPRLQPRLVAARSIVLRIPFLVGMGQQSVAVVELRRFVELVCWTVYFSDHHVEWQCFQHEPGAGFSQEGRKPISYAAHRELSYYIEYARELMQAEDSGLAVEAVDGLKQASHQLNASVHAGQLAQATVMMKAPHEAISDAGLRKFGAIQRQVFANCCVILSAYCRPQFDKLNAAGRAHFDWLVGAKVRRKIRQGPFGLKRL
jgi:hypothetical protein